MPANPLASLRTLLFDRILGLQKHEYVPVGWSFAYFFCVLSSYYILRPVRESMAVGSGPNTIPWLFFGTFVAMIVVTPIFGWVSSRFSRHQFLPWVYVFFIGNILIFWSVFSVAVSIASVSQEIWDFVALLIPAWSPPDDSNLIWLGRIFFVWISIFNLFVVSVFWSFMADIYTREQGRRLFGFVTAGGSIGALIGGSMTSLLVEDIGFQNLFPIAAGVLLVAVICIFRLREFVENDQTGAVAKQAAIEKPLGGNPFAGITHIAGSRYFLGIAFTSVIASLLGTALYMFMAQLVEVEITAPDAAKQAAMRTAFFSDINNWTNALSLLGQMLIVKHVVERFGIGASLTLLPIASIAGFIILAFEPTLVFVAILTVLRRALGFGFSKPTTDMLYSVVTPEEKYKTKNFIDTAIYRGGDLVGTLIVRGLIALGMGLAAISVAMLPFAAAWAAVSYWLGRDYRRQAKQLRESGIT
jgi:AAA family ATP:ADP antiporter